MSHEIRLKTTSEDTIDQWRTEPGPCIYTKHTTVCRAEHLLPLSHQGEAGTRAPQVKENFSLCLHAVKEAFLELTEEKH